MSEEHDALLRELGRAVLENVTGMPGPKGYLLYPAPHLDPSDSSLACPACAAVSPDAGGGGHEQGCPLAAILDGRNTR